MLMLTRKQKEAHVQDLESLSRRRSQWSDIVARLLRNKLAIVGLVIVAVIVLGVVFAGILTPYDYDMQDYGSRFMTPCLEHPFGTDNFGRDLLSRILFGGRVSLLVALLAVAISIVIGLFLGATAGYFGGAYEVVVMRLTDVVMAIPGLLLAVAISAGLGTGVFNTALAISISGIPPTVRMMRSTVLQIRDEEYVEAARATGSRDMRIIFRHVLPNTIAPLIVDSTLRIGINILQISSLSFVGLGIQPPTPEWGSILSAGRAYIQDYWPLITFPGLAIMLTLLGFNLLGDGLRDALDPRLRQ